MRLVIYTSYVNDEFPSDNVENGDGKSFPLRLINAKFIVQRRTDMIMPEANIVLIFVQTLFFFFSYK